MKSQPAFSFNIIALFRGGRRLISWWDMIQFQAVHMLPPWEALGLAAADAESCLNDGQNLLLSDGMVPDGMKSEMRHTLSLVKALCQELGLHASEMRQVHFYGLLTDSLGITLK